MNFMDKEVDGIFEIGNRKFKVVKSSEYDCDGCYFQRNRINCIAMQLGDMLPKCSAESRIDGNSVIFKCINDK